MSDALGLRQEPGDFPERSATPVVVVPYDPRWPLLFEQERRAIIEALGDEVVRIEHVGSTSVPGLASKPVLDMAMTIRDLARASACIEPLAALGYVYVPEFEADLPNRRYFRKDGRPLYRTHHLHMYADGHPEFLEYVRFRDHLRTDAVIRAGYEQLKRELATTCGRAEYTRGKGPFIRQVLDGPREP